MKVLTLLRHAKSGWDDPALRDFDRPLNARGRRAARTVGREMRRLGLCFDRLLASPARRVVETLDEVAAAFGPLARDYDRRLYLAAPETILEAVRESLDESERLLVVAHNPGLEQLALMLAADNALRSEIEVKYPTGTLAEIEFAAAAEWTDVAPGTGSLTRFIRPRDLDPELGPDD